MTHPPLFRDLSDAEQGALLLAKHRGQKIESWGRWIWYELPEPRFHDGNAYRIAPTPDTIDWSHLAPEWRFVTRDKSEIAWAYKSRPDLKNNHWCARCEYGARVITPSYRKNGMPWDQSLIERPENE